MLVQTRVVNSTLGHHRICSCLRLSAGQPLRSLRSRDRGDRIYSLSAIAQPNLPSSIFDLASLQRLQLPAAVSDVYLFTVGSAECEVTPQLQKQFGMACDALTLLSGTVLLIGIVRALSLTPEQAYHPRLIKPKQSPASRTYTAISKCGSTEHAPISPNFSNSLKRLLTPLSRENTVTFVTGMTVPQWTLLEGIAYTSLCNLPRAYS